MKYENTDNGQHVYDMLIIGGGPGGYTAALYAARAGLDTVVLERMAAGGQMAVTTDIDNYPGFENGINGFELGEKMRKGAERFGVKTVMTEVLSVRLSSPVKVAETPQGSFSGKTVIIATGANPRALEVKGEKELTGHGVSYCATCDGMFFRDKNVVVVGGGNSAAEDALILSRICKTVTLVHWQDKLNATKIYRDALEESENIHFRWDSAVVELLGESKVTGIRIRDLKTEQEQSLPCDGVFICIGRTPASELVKGVLPLTQEGYIMADESTRTNLPGVFAVGDVRTKVIRQIVSAVSDGATAVHYAENYLTETAELTVPV